MLTLNAYPFFISDVIGIIFFSISGAMVATRKKLDLLGLSIAATLTALGGGIMRDVIVGRSPISFHMSYPSITLFITLILFLYYKLHNKEGLQERFFFILSDTIGLVAFSITGALVAIDAKLNLFGIVMLAFITAVGGGVIRDIMINKVPTILISDFYGSIAILVAIQLYICNKLEVLTPIIILAIAIFTASIRLLAYYKSWKLPRF